MLIRRETLDAIAEGRVSVLYRRWRKPAARPGGRQRTAIGVLAVDAVELVDPAALSREDLARGGFASREELLASLRPAGEGDVYRVAVRLAGADPRLALRDAVPGEGEALALRERLERMDARSTHGPWTRDTLGLIAAFPAERAASLAAKAGRPTLPFKADVRKLKELGLTESLDVGYRLSPRGRALLDALKDFAEA